MKIREREKFTCRVHNHLAGNSNNIWYIDRLVSGISVCAMWRERYLMGFIIHRIAYED